VASASKEAAFLASADAEQSFTHYYSSSTPGINLVN
jgi:hypothetical protein